MAQNMQFIYTNIGTVGTYIFSDNPFPYIKTRIDITERYRQSNKKLISYNRGYYHTFELIFDNIGTSQYANFGTIWNLRTSFDFYPFDEVEGTTTKYTVEIINDFNFSLINPWWDSGYKGNITLEEV